MLNPKNTIIDVLNIINYKNDKAKFADNFLELCMKQSFLEMIGDLPKEKVTFLQKQIQSARDLDQFLSILKKYIHPLYLKRNIEQVSAKLFEEYIEEIIPTLDETTKTKLFLYLEKVGN